jgi:hypothetical protein
MTSDGLIPPCDLIVPNSGLAIFLYDQANAKRIGGSGAPVLSGMSPSALRDEATAKLLREGALLVIGLPQDDDFHARLTVDAAAGDATPESAQGWLDLRSGTLRVDSYDTLPMGDGGDGAEGAAVQLPPGRYQVRVYGAPGGGHRLLLMPIEGSQPEGSNVLFGARLGFDEALGKDSGGTVQGGVWSGRVVLQADAHPKFGAPYLALDLDAKAIRALKLAWGDRLILEAAGAEHHVFYRGDTNAWRTFEAVRVPGSSSGCAPDSGLEAALEDADDGFTEIPGVAAWLAVRGHAPAGLTELPPGTPVRARKGKPSFAAAPRLTGGRDGDSLRGQVIASREGMTVTSIPGTALAELRLRPADGLEVVIGETVHPAALRVTELGRRPAEPVPVWLQPRPYWGNPRLYAIALSSPFGATVPLPAHAEGTPVLVRRV